MNREIILARCILIISIIILVLTVLWDLEFIQSEILLYVLIGLLALLMFLVMQFIRNYICLFDYLFISSQMSAKPYFIGSTGILLLW